jgi:hypothetical protein
MMPHCFYFATYASLRIPIHLADGSTTYSLGVGSVVFAPVINGQKQHAVEFTRVLHVPQLHVNLLSVLFLAKHKQLNTYIPSNTICVIQHGLLLFTAHISNQNSAHLDGTTLVSSGAFIVGQAASSVLTSRNLTLWHKQIMHHNVLGLVRLLHDNC